MMKLKKEHRFAIAIAVILYAITWIFGHPAVRESIDKVEGRHGQLRARSVPVLPCVLVCSSNNMAELGGRWAIGIYIWYGFGVKRIVEMPMLVAWIGTGGVQHAVAGYGSRARRT